MLAAAFAALTTAAAPAGSVLAYPAFPASSDFTVAAQWAARQTDIAEGDLLDARNGYAFAVMPAPTRQGLRRLRLEALDARTWKALGGRSGELTVDLACGPAHLAPVSLVVYAGSNRRGARRSGVDPAVLHLSEGALAALATGLCSTAMQARPVTAIAPPTVVALPPLSVAVTLGVYPNQIVGLRDLGTLSRGQPLATRMEPVITRGKAGYRGLLTGFASEAEASDFCLRLILISRYCQVLRVR